MASRSYGVGSRQSSTLRSCSWVVWGYGGFSFGSWSTWCWVQSAPPFGFASTMHVKDEVYGRDVIAPDVPTRHTLCCKDFFLGASCSSFGLPAPHQDSTHGPRKQPRLAWVYSSPMCSSHRWACLAPAWRCWPRASLSGASIGSFQATR